ncbi:hypothetical protein D3P08_10810 [Paenibacillus nanensis]|uniref:PKD domain-containing protein n=1 Tax=Paenibacillus nanensis TaxID=393251 RepID=A0A3A1UX47_9BACL|nr:hypothetical protein [Paenibacillus nanensis]RIX53119.1 hypothetical protein D3P08_10810 [Paenibacillus nanensis]
MKRVSTIRKALLSVIILTLILDLLPMNTEMIAEASSYNGLTACESSYKKIHGDRLPPNQKKCIKRESDGQYIMFNWSLYEGLKVISYGKVEAANTKSNDFKTGWRDLQNEDREDYNGTHPYFTKNGVRGEYRYLGWDINGRLYSNMYFIPDKDFGIDPSEKKWIYRPWDSPLAKKSSRAPSGFSPIFLGNDLYDSPWVIIHNSKEKQVNKLLNAPSVKVKYQALPDYYVDKTNPKNIFEYMYVEQMPTSLAPGSGTMFHQAANGSIWYQTFYLKPLDASQKEKLPVSATISEAPQIKTIDLGVLPENFTWSWKLQGEILDDNYVKTKIDKAMYYTRDDIKEWRFEVAYSWPGGSKTETLSSSNNGGLTISKGNKIAVKNPELSIDFDKKKQKLKKGDKVEIKLTTKAIFNTPDGSVVFSSDSDTYTITFTGDPPPPTEDDDEPTSTPTPTATPKPSATPKPTTPPLVCSFDIPDDAFDIVPFEGVWDNTDLSRVVIREVAVDGVPVDPEKFWTGKYVFGDDADGLRTVAVKWTPKDVPWEWTEECDTYRIVNVHDTKPRAQFKLYGGTFKENRKMSIENTSYDPNANDPFVQAVYPIVDAEWTWTALDGTDSDRKMRTDTKDSKVFLYKNAGEYQVTLRVTNALGRTSDPYVLPFSVLEDYAPAVIMHPYSSEIARGEPLSLMYEGVSTDGDNITKHTIKVYYDEKHDGTYSKLIDTFNAPISEYIPSLSALGNYRIISTVEEEFGQETLSEFITGADKRKTTQQFEFMIDNYIPYSDITTDIPSVMQQVDIGILLDKNLEVSKLDYVNSNGVGINNLFRYQGIDPSIKVWDMHTYTRSQAASTAVNTGRVIPPETTEYCAEGYCGTLKRDDYQDNGGYFDRGYNQKVVDVPGYWKPWCKYTDSYGRPWSHAPPCDDPKNATSEWVEPIYRDEWVPVIVWESNYWGYYSGLIYKDVRQPFINPFVRTAADRYLVYISDSSINELSDFNMVKGLSDAKIILVGSEAIKSMSNYDHYISGSLPIEEVINQVVDYIASHNPPTASQTVLMNESFKMITDESDPEKDAIVQRQIMYVHNPNYYDNPMGKATFAAEEYNPAAWTSETLRTSFSLPGEYTVYRRVKDQPSIDPKLAKYSYWSNEAKTVIKVHRKPIALAELDWTYDTSCGCYNTKWIDKSYDLDHNVTDTVNRGIVDRKIKYTVGGVTYYQIPDKLAPGNYQLEYVVKDVEGVWSDPFTMNFNLTASPPVQLKGKLKSKLSVFSVNSIPHGEQLTLYDIWTRYPYSTSLEIQMTDSKGGTSYPTGGIYDYSWPKEVKYYTGTKKGNDIYWAPEDLTLPTTMLDGDYFVKLKAKGLTSKEDTQVMLPFKVFTPINLESSFPDVVYIGESYKFTATTTKYPTQAIARLASPYFGGDFTGFFLTGTTTSANGIGSKSWESASFTIPESWLGDFQLTINAYLPGKWETWTHTFKVMRKPTNRPPEADFDWSPKPVYEGDTVTFKSIVSDLDNDTLAAEYELTSPSGVKTKTNYSFNNPYPGTGPVHRLVEPGTWRMKLTVNDGKAPPVIVEKAVTVRPLHIAGQVLHTELWNEHRQEYNRKKSGNAESPRGYGVFWAGEKFVLHADTSSTGSSTRTNRVEAAFGEYSVVLTASDASKTSWNGELWDESFEASLQDGPATFTFKAYYSNGTVKTTNVTIEIRGDASQIIGVHRVQ